MLVVPLAVVPSQTLVITLGEQPAQIALRTMGLHLYFTLEGVVTNRICRNEQRLLVDAKYRGFLGDFAFIDTQGDTDPVFTGFGTRYQLVYFDDGE